MTYTNNHCDISDCKQSNSVPRRLPFYFVSQNNAVGCVFAGKRVAAILHAEHYQRFVAVVAYGSPACWRNPYHGAFLYGEYFAVYLVFTFAAEEEI